MVWVQADKGARTAYVLTQMYQVAEDSHTHPHVPNIYKMWHSSNNKSTANHNHALPQFHTCFSYLNLPPNNQLWLGQVTITTISGKEYTIPTTLPHLPPTAAQELTTLLHPHPHLGSRPSLIQNSGLVGLNVADGKTSWVLQKDLGVLALTSHMATATAPAPAPAMVAVGAMKDATAVEKATPNLAAPATRRPNISRTTRWLRPPPLPPPKRKRTAVPTRLCATRQRTRLKRSPTRRRVASLAVGVDDVTVGAVAGAVGRADRTTVGPLPKGPSDRGDRLAVACSAVVPVDDLPATADLLGLLRSLPCSRVCSAVLVALPTVMDTAHAAHRRRLPAQVVPLTSAA